MVIDKTGILKLLRKDINDLEEHKGEDSILITTRYNDFCSDSQISNDSIDLRIGNCGYIISNDYEYINTLSDEDFSKYFVKVELDVSKGYDLKPRELLFIDTLEQIHLSGNLIGRITGRSVFSRFGLSIHCTQDKFSSGINSIAALQIVNNSNTILRIFPYQKLAQLIIEKTGPNNHPYNSSTFSLEKCYTLPKVKSQDRAQYDLRTQEIILSHRPKKKSFIRKREKTSKISILTEAVLGGITTLCFSIISLFEYSTIALFSMIMIGFIYVLVSFYLVYTSGKNE